MTSLEYRFNQSSPILEELSRISLRTPLLSPSHKDSESINSFEYIDKSLSLLGHLQKAQDDRLRHEFDQQRRFITDKFEHGQYENGQRDAAVSQRFTTIEEQLDRFKAKVELFKEEVGQRFEEVGQRFEEVGQRFEEVGQRFDAIEKQMNDFREEVGQRFGEMNARMFNSLSYRAHHHIHPVAILKKGRGLQQPDAKFFPSTIKQFWNLQSSRNAYARFYLLEFYSIEEYKRWTEHDDSGSDSDDSSPESLNLEQAVRSYPMRCLEVLAARLGLDYDKIHTQIQRQSQPPEPVQPSKRGQLEEMAEQKSQTSKRMHMTSPSTSSKRSAKSAHSARLQVRNSPGSTDIIPETNITESEKASPGDTELLSSSGKASTR